MRAGRGSMSDEVPLAGDPTAIKTIEDFVTPSSARGPGLPPSKVRPQPRTQDGRTSRSLRWSSKPSHQGLLVTSFEHALGAVKHALLLRDLSVCELREMADGGQERIYSRNESIFAEGDPLRCVTMVTSGHAKIIRHSALGKLVILHLCGPGDVLDGLGCTSGSRHTVEARAVKHCRVLSWDVRRFESLSSRFPALRRNSIRLLLARLRILEGRVHELATDRVPQRLAKILLRLILQGQGSVRRPWIDLTGEDLAQMVGTTQCTISRLLCDWAAQRIIQPERTAILVENLPGLIAIAMQVDCAS